MKQKKSKKQLLAKFHFIGGFLTSPSLSTHCKTEVREAIRKKYTDHNRGSDDRAEAPCVGKGQ